MRFFRKLLHFLESCVLRINLLFIAGLLLLSSSLLNAQTDTLATRQYFYDFKYISGYFITPKFSTDSNTLNALFFDPVRKQRVYSAVTGNPGAAANSHFLSNYDFSGLRDGFNQFDDYKLIPFRDLPSEIRKNRYSVIDYHLASKKEQHILINHEQHIRPFWMAGIDFGALSSQGDFARQINTNRNFRIWHAYEAPAATYRSYISFTASKVLNQENGGITSDSSFENATSLDTRTLPIFLSDASSQIKSRDYFLRQEISLNKFFMKSDSTSAVTDFHDGAIILSHALWYKRKSILFNSLNPDSGYFSNFFIDTVSTVDTSFFGRMQNEISLDYHSSAARFRYYLGAGLNSEQVEYFITLTDTTYSILKGLFRAGFTLGRFSMNADLAVNVDGDFEDFRHASLNLKYQSGNDDLIYLRYASGVYPQSLKDYYYFSNHFAWYNDFNHVEKSEISAGIELPKLRTSLRFSNYFEKYRVFYREDFLPQVYASMLSYGQFSLRNMVKLGKFGIEDKFDFSYSGNENVLRVPSFAGYAAVFYDDLFFKKALGFRAGLDLSYFSSYYAYGYMPATGVFYLQDEKEIGNYPMVGVFVQMKIKTASLFLRVDHANAGMSSRTYYGAYGYPLPGRTLKFGVNWQLTD